MIAAALSLVLLTQARPATISAESAGSVRVGPGLGLATPHLSPDQSLAMVQSLPDGKVIVWSTRDRKELGRFVSLSDAAFDRANQVYFATPTSLIVADPRTNRSQPITLSGNTFEWQKLTNAPWNLLVNGDGTFMYTQTGVLSQINLRTGATKLFSAESVPGRTPIGLYLSEDGTMIFSQRATASVFQTSDASLVTSFELASDPSAGVPRLIPSKDLEHYVGITGTGVSQLYARTLAKPRASLAIPVEEGQSLVNLLRANPIVSAAFSADASRVYIIRQDGLCHIFQTETAAFARTVRLAGGSDTVRAWGSEDGLVLARYQTVQGQGGTVVQMSRYRIR